LNKISSLGDILYVAPSKWIDFIRVKI